ncbi:uncharacterized protein KY384_000485 [Bacidia gigantensis]|uniref:uncharacterized protein n=1 Tax=Bacidia gigantensis TaxID=2732470 RepID=UPI001D04D728|nr:uncharacterized protein KY384_000485 [Bacidia gigantensis]KAG8525725.1 hypothetical protein KY384_000485 [Bacidia gigantensis]
MEKNNDELLSDVGGFHLTVPKISTPSLQADDSPDDGYHYIDEDEAPEDIATVERPIPGNREPEQGQSQVLRPQGTHPTQSTDAARATTYQRQAGYRRAVLPYKEDQDAYGPRKSDDESQSKHGSILKHASTKSKAKRPHSPKSNIPRAQVKLRNIFLQRHELSSNAQNRIEFDQVVSNDKSRTQMIQEGCVLWQHTKLDCLSMSTFADQITKMRHHGVHDSVNELAEHLFERVHKKAEKSFVGGKYLEPDSTRYDSVDNSKYSIDKYCTFISFPYFALEKFPPTVSIEGTKGTDKHPPRSLLQSYYRLYNTHRRDKAQCLKLLKDGVLRSGIENDSEELQRLMPMIRDRILYVPQLWCYIAEPGQIITTGCVSDSDLQGKFVKVNSRLLPDQGSLFRLVRFHFVSGEEQESLTYPLKQCASWYGLMNKQQQIRLLSNDRQDSADPSNYRLTYKEQVVDKWNWASLQSSSKEEDIIELWMESPGVSGDKRLYGGREQGTTLPKSKDLETLMRHKESGVHSSFLTWPIMDAAGVVDETPENERMQRFLEMIYQALPAFLAGANIQVSHRALGYGSATIDRVEVRGGIKDGKDSSHPQNSTAFYASARKFLLSFVPASHDQEQEAIRLFWGVLRELSDHGSVPYLNQLEDLLARLNKTATEIHLGVHHPSKESHEQENGKLDQSGSAVLLASLVDALGAGFHMLIEALREIRSDKKAKVCGTEVQRLFDEALKCLKTAEGELIKEAKGIRRGNHLESVPTPEMILLNLIERLVDGVVKDDVIDVIDIYGRCLEGLSLRVTDKYSRTFLQYINSFKEEVKIVEHVIMQQRHVLLRLQDRLDPKTFDSPSVFRKMRFKSEQKFIEKILLTLQEQLQNCAELKERVQDLADQNIQLVETLQDRAIFIFTLVTIVFLPLSFVSSYFGMNVIGINDNSKVELFLYQFQSVRYTLDFLTINVESMLKAYRTECQDFRSVKAALQQVVENFPSVPQSEALYTPSITKSRKCI